MIAPRFVYSSPLVEGRRMPKPKKNDYASWAMGLATIVFIVLIVTGVIHKP